MTLIQLADLAEMPTRCTMELSLLHHARTCSTSLLDPVTYRISTTKVSLSSYDETRQAEALVGYLATACSVLLMGYTTSIRALFRD